MNHDLQHLIEVATQLKEAVTRLGEAYDLMPTVIDKEHRAIRASDFGAVQEALVDKEAAGAQIEECFAALTQAADRLAMLRADPSQRPRTLKDCVAALNEVVAATATEDLGVQVLRHQTEGLARVAADFDRRFQRIKPMIEANRMLVGGMLQHMQDSYRFWQEVAEKVESAYNARGVQESKGRNSGFVVKA